MQSLFKYFHSYKPNGFLVNYSNGHTGYIRIVGCLDDLGNLLDLDIQAEGGTLAGWGTLLGEDTLLSTLSD